MYGQFSKNLQTPIFQTITGIERLYAKCYNKSFLFMFKSVERLYPKYGPLSLSLSLRAVRTHPEVRSGPVGSAQRYWDGRIH